MHQLHLHPHFDPIQACGHTIDALLELGHALNYHGTCGRPWALRQSLQSPSWITASECAEGARDVTPAGAGIESGSCSGCELESAETGPTLVSRTCSAPEWPRSPCVQSARAESWCINSTTGSGPSRWPGCLSTHCCSWGVSTQWTSNGGGGQRGEGPQGTALAAGDQKMDEGLLDEFLTAIDHEKRAHEELVFHLKDKAPANIPEL